MDNMDNNCPFEPEPAREPEPEISKYLGLSYLELGLSLLDFGLGLARGLGLEKGN